MIRLGSNLSYDTSKFNQKELEEAESKTKKISQEFGHEFRLGVFGHNLCAACVLSKEEDLVSQIPDEKYGLVIGYNIYATTYTFCCKKHGR